MGRCLEDSEPMPKAPNIPVAPQERMRTGAATMPACTAVTATSRRWAVLRKAQTTRGRRDADPVPRRARATMSRAMQSAAMCRRRRVHRRARGMLRGTSLLGQVAATAGPPAKPHRRTARTTTRLTRRSRRRSGGAATTWPRIAASATQRRRRAPGLGRGLAQVATRRTTSPHRVRQRGVPWFPCWCSLPASS